PLPLGGWCASVPCVVRRDARRAEQQAAQRDLFEQSLVEPLTGVESRQEQIERAWLTEELARCQAEYRHPADVADPAGRAWLGRNTDLVHFATGTAQSFEDGVERIGARGASSHDQLRAMRQHLAVPRGKVGYGRRGADNRIER